MASSCRVLLSGPHDLLYHRVLRPSAPAPFHNWNRCRARGELGLFCKDKGLLGLAWGAAPGPWPLLAPRACRNWNALGVQQRADVAELRKPRKPSLIKCRWKPPGSGEALLCCQNLRRAIPHWPLPNRRRVPVLREPEQNLTWQAATQAANQSILLAGWRKSILQHSNKG